jgi:hypothetical protein
LGTTSGAALARVGFLTDNVKVFGFVIKNLAMRIRQKLQKSWPRADRERCAWVEML